MNHTYRLLERIRSPHDVRALPPSEVPQLAEEIRSFLVEKVAATGGHLGPNLGVVELSIALHRVFYSPDDAIIWDTGHQAYVHKILTGRGPDFDSLRREGGLSGYPSRVCPMTSGKSAQRRACRPIRERYSSDRSTNGRIPPCR
jgi:1-deoxy-D-xylulose-5-phosphate synthase